MHFSISREEDQILNEQGGVSFIGSLKHYECIEIIAKQLNGLMNIKNRYWKGYQQETKLV